MNTLFCDNEMKDLKEGLCFRSPIGNWLEVVVLVSAVATWSATHKYHSWHSTFGRNYLPPLDVVTGYHEDIAKQSYLCRLR